MKQRRQKRSNTLLWRGDPSKINSGTHRLSDGTEVNLSCLYYVGLALQIPPYLLYFRPLKLTFSALLVGSLLEKNRTLRLIPREQVSEGLFMIRP